MKRIDKNITLVLTCLLFLMIGVSGGLAAVDTDADLLTPPVVTGRQLMQEKIDYLMATLRERLAQIPESDRPALVVGEDFAGVSGLEQLQKDVLDPNHPLHDAVQKAGRLAQDAKSRPALADDANLYLNLAILDALDELLKNPSLTDEMKNTVYALIDLLKELELPEAYQAPDTRFGFTVVDRPDDRDRTDRGGEEDGVDPVPGRGFVYYGKSYDLDTDVSIDPRGFIVFADGQVDTDSINFSALDPQDNLPAALSPLVGLGGELGLMVRGGDVEKTDLRYTYRWEVSDYYNEMPGLDTSASLYTNDWIVFDYQSQAPDSPDFEFAGLAGLSPGDGSVGSGHPGEGQDRNWWTGSDFVERTLGSGQSSLDFSGSDYTAVHNYPIEGPRPYVVADTFFIFRPYEWTDSGAYSETPNKYMVTAGTRSILAGGLSSLDEAIALVEDDLDARYQADSGEFLPGEMTPPYSGGIGSSSSGPGTGYYPINWSGYEFGLQTVGQDAQGKPFFFDTPPHPTVGPGLGLINGDGFLAYAVQVEEDIVNRKILEMHQDAVAAGRINTLMDNINTAKGYSNIRERDAWLARQSDAQAGRVLRDQNGNWVRVQQYVLRPDANSVQVLSASLRDVAGKEELSTLDFTTTFHNVGYGLDKDLTKLPWNSWLNTQLDDDGLKYVKTSPRYPLLESMAVTLQNPQGEEFAESRMFTATFNQFVTSEQLVVNGIFYSNQYNLASPADSTIGFSTSSTSAGFNYNFENGRDPINVSFYELSGNNAQKSNQTYKDIWDALRVNSGGSAPDIGDSSLEIVITDGAATPTFNAFDVVYIPMSRMLWKDKTGEHNIVIPPDSEV